jgi:hypothetical protein
MAPGQGIQPGPPNIDEVNFRNSSVGCPEQVRIVTALKTLLTQVTTGAAIPSNIDYIGQRYFFPLLKSYTTLEFASWAMPCVTSRINPPTQARNTPTTMQKASECIIIMTYTFDQSYPQLACAGQTTDKANPW